MFGVIICLSFYLIVDTIIFDQTSLSFSNERFEEHYHESFDDWNFVPETDRDVIRAARSPNLEFEPRQSDGTDKNDISYLQQIKFVDKIPYVKEGFDVEENDEEDEVLVRVKRALNPQPRHSGGSSKSGSRSSSGSSSTRHSPRS